MRLVDVGRRVCVVSCPNATAEPNASSAPAQSRTFDLWICCIDVLQLRRPRMAPVDDLRAGDQMGHNWLTGPPNDVTSSRHQQRAQAFRVARWNDCEGSLREVADQPS